jgi:hypothetical protein
VPFHDKPGRLRQTPLRWPEQVYRYLGRYPHRVAIGNARLVTVDKDTVVFPTRGSETAALSPTEFINSPPDHHKDELPAIRAVDPNSTSQVRLLGLTGQDVLL